MTNRHIFPHTACITLLLVMLIAVLSATVSCSDKKTNKTNEDTSTKVAVTPTLDCLPIIIAVDKGWAEKNKLPLDIVMYQAHNDCDTALTNKRVVAGFTDNVRAKIMNGKGAGLLLMPHDNLSWILITSGAQRITEVKQLKDKMIGMTRLSATEQLSEHVIDAAKLSVQQTFLIPINSLTIRQKMISSNEIDAAWLPQPQAQQAISNGGKILTKSETQGMDLYGVVAFPTKETKKFKPLKTAERQTFKKLYNEACDSLNQRGMEFYSEIITKRLGLTDKDIKALGKQLFRHL